MEKLYLFIWLWGNKKKLEDEKLKQEIKDQNDILKEEFDIRNILSLAITFRAQ